MVISKWCADATQILTRIIQLKGIILHRDVQFGEKLIATLAFENLMDSWKVVNFAFDELIELMKIAHPPNSSLLEMMKVGGSHAAVPTCSNTPISTRWLSSSLNTCQ